MPKEYPLRNEGDYGQDLIEICECGHQKHYHSVLNDGSCDFCACPKFTYEQTLTRSDALKLSREIRSRNIRQGYTT